MKAGRQEEPPTDAEDLDTTPSEAREELSVSEVPQLDWSLDRTWRIRENGEKA